jgi:phage gpG-like protein
MVTMRHTVDFSTWSTPLEEAARAAGDLTPANKQVGELLINIVDRNFATEGGPEKWPELSVETLIARAAGRSGTGQVFHDRVIGGAERMGPLGRDAARVRAAGGRDLTARAQKVLDHGAKPLIWSGRLLRSITYRAAELFVDVGSNLVQAARLFFGSRTGVTPVTPARNPFGLTGQDKDDIHRIYVRHLFVWFTGGAG